MHEEWPYPKEIQIVTHEMRIVRGISKDGSPLYACRFVEDGECKAITDQVVGLGMIESLRVDYLQRLGAVAGFQSYDAEKDTE